MATIFISPTHEFVNGQTVVIDQTDSYDGSYDITRIDADTFSGDVDYSQEAEGVSYPLMDSVYYIVFLYDIEDIFSEVKLKTVMKARNIKTESGNILMNEIALTEDRMDMFDILIKEAANHVSLKLQAYAKGIVNAYKFNQQIAFDGGTPAEDSPYYIHYAIKEDKDNQDENIYPLIEGKIKECLVSLVLKDWYESASMAQDYQLNSMKADELFKDIGSLLMKAEGHKRVRFHEGF